jgi:surface antigen
MRAGARASETARRRRRWAATAALVVLALAGASGPARAHAVTAGLSLRVRITEADTIGIVVEAGAFRHEECGAEIRMGGREEGAPSVETGTEGGARWSWLVPGNVAAGRWHVTVSCRRGTGTQTAERAFPVEAGDGRKSSGLWIPGSMHTEAYRLPARKGGNGGGSTPLYPVGQCTWWVARRRPDLPYFPEAAGDALNWGKSAAAAGFTVGDAPEVGAVAVFQPGQYGAGPYGHVAYVTAVEGEEIRISEDNYHGRRHPDTRTILDAGLQFIYREGGVPARATAPSPPASTPSPGAAPAGPYSVELSGASADQVVSGALALRATSDAPAVRFSAFYYADPADRTTGRTVEIGEDTTPADGFTATWDTSSVPNQGGPGGSSVVITANAVGPEGIPVEPGSSVRVSVANPRAEGGHTFYPYYVVGTCEDGQCGLHLREGPGYTEYATVETRPDGAEVDVVCQAEGETYTSARTGSSSNVWDELTDGDWVTDYYVDTPERGAFSEPPLARCP